jgi:hypothetical protein
MLRPLTLRGSRLPRGSHPPRPAPGARAPSAPSACPAGLPKYCGLPKYRWAGAATPTQRNITQASATTERSGNDMSNGTPVTGKGNPTWSFSNTPETVTPWRNDLLRPPAPRLRRLAGHPLAPGGGILCEISARLAGIPRRIGTRLFLAADEEAHWRGWQVTPLHGGLGRSSRDPRFHRLSTPSEPNGQVPLGQAPPDGDQ